MSRTYNFRTRTDAGIANQPRVSTAESRPRVVAAGTRDPPPYVPSPAHNANSTTALYSDVVASRPPSPRGEKNTEPVEAQAVEDERLESKVPVIDNTIPTINDNNSSYEEIPHDRDENNSPWTTVIHRHRRARSLSSLNGPRTYNREAGTNFRRELTTEQARVVDAATNNLTVQQKETLKQRHNKMNSPQSPAYSNGEGPSRNKGKGINSREWGNINISQESLDVEAQVAALESYAKRPHELIKKKHGRKA